MACVSTTMPQAVDIPVKCVCGGEGGGGGEKGLGLLCWHGHSLRGARRGLLEEGGLCGHRDVVVLHASNRLLIYRAAQNSKPYK